VYRDLNIGAAKPTPAELAQYPHELIDICDPTEIYSAGQYCHDAHRCIAKIKSLGKIPLLVGGTMLFFHRLQQGFSELPKRAPDIRAQIEQEATEHGWQFLYERLGALDPIAQQRIHRNDQRRIERALEIYYLTGKTKTETLSQSVATVGTYRFVNIMLVPHNRQDHQQKIAMRFDAMLKAGFIDEVTHLRQQYQIHAQLPCMRAVGYRQIWDYLEGSCTYAEMVSQCIIATRQLAKRQLTWLTQFKEGVCFAGDAKNSKEAIVDYLHHVLQYHLRSEH
jgi:tRNA dimethylallyltransferase